MQFLFGFPTKYPKTPNKPKKELPWKLPVRRLITAGPVKGQSWVLIDIDPRRKLAPFPTIYTAGASTITDVYQAPSFLASPKRIPKMHLNVMLVIVEADMLLSSGP